MIHERLKALTSTTEAVYPYKTEWSPLKRAIIKSIFYMTIVGSALFYGLSVVLLPPILLLYFSTPILVLSLLVLWALPDGGRGPRGFVTACFFMFVAAIVLWPDYMAVQIPGFAWISFRRIWSWALGAGILLCLAVSKDFREQLKSRMKVTRLFWIMAAIFFAVSWLTIPISGNPIRSVNQSLNQMFVWAIPLIAATFVFYDSKNIIRFAWFVIAAALINSVIGVAEYFNGQLLWAGHIPAFLTVQDEILQKILSGAVRDGVYRVTTVFTVSLCLAEFLALAIPFALMRAFSSQNIGRIILWSGVDLLLLGAIVLTNSRLGIVGWIVSHSVFILLWGCKRWLGGGRDLIGPAVSLAFPVAATVFLFAMFTVPAVHNRTIGGGSTGYSDNARQEQFALFWPKLFRNPIGYGTAQSGETLGYLTPGGMLTVDSYFITVGLDYGIAGLVCFFGMFFFTFGMMVHIYLSKTTREAEYALPIACSIAVMFFVRLVLSQPDNVPLIFVLFGMAVALFARTRAEAANAPSVDYRLSIQEGARRLDQRERIPQIA